MAKQRTIKTRAARKKAQLELNRINQTKKEKDNEVKPKEATFTEEVIGPIARMLGHTLSSAAAYAVWCAAEILMGKLLPMIFHLGNEHQLALFEAGETVILYTGFGIWVVTFLVGATRLVLAEIKIIFKK